jgi:hypothetical protein
VFELCRVTQGSCDFARLISKLVQAVLAAHHQQSIQRGFEFLLRQDASGPTSTASQVFKIPARIACTAARRQ